MISTFQKCFGSVRCFIHSSVSLPFPTPFHYPLSHEINKLDNWIDDEEGNVDAIETISCRTRKIEFHFRNWRGLNQHRTKGREKKKAFVYQQFSMFFHFCRAFFIQYKKIEHLMFLKSQIHGIHFNSFSFHHQFESFQKKKLK